MKKLLLISLSFFTLCSFSGISGLDEVISGLRAGNATQMAKYFDNTVEISLPARSNTYSKSQAEMVLKDFFKNHTVKSFTVIHSGENKVSQFCIGNLVTAAGNFRTTLQMKLKGDKQVLQEIKFEQK